MSEALQDIVTVLVTGLRLTVRAKPGISRARVLKIVDIGDGKRALEVAVAAAAEDGKANSAIIERLADEWDIPKQAITIKTGTTSRLKIVELSGDAQLLLAKIGNSL